MEKEKLCYFFKSIFNRIKDIPESIFWVINLSQWFGYMGEFTQLESEEVLKSYQDEWGEKIEWISDECKEKIIKASKKIKVKVYLDNDGSRLIVMKLNNKIIKILDPNLENHSDDDCWCDNEGSYLVDIYSMVGYVDSWDNWKLKEYVNKIENDIIWLHIPGIEEIREVLFEISSIAWLDWDKYWNESIAMLMYLTGLSWKYWVKSESHVSQGTHIIRHACLQILSCYANYRGFDSHEYSRYINNLLMISIDLLWKESKN